MVACLLYWSGGPFWGSEGAFWLLLLTATVLPFIWLAEGSVVVKKLVGVLAGMSSLFFLLYELLSLFLLAELLLFPLLLLLLGYGSQVQKMFASYVLLLYSVACSTPLLWALASSVTSLSLPLDSLVVNPGWLLFICLSLCIKLPLYWLHLWLPLVHVEAPTSVSVFLAGVLLKLGSYGLSVFVSYLHWTHTFFYVVWSLFGLVFCTVYSLTVSDTKVLLAYSSVSHMSFLSLCLFFLSQSTLFGGYLLIVGHGVVSSVLFLLIGILYASVGTRLIYITVGVWASSAGFCLVAGLVLFWSGGCPVTPSFVSEVLGVSFLYYYSPLFLFFACSFFLLSFYLPLGFFVGLFVGKGGLSLPLGALGPVGVLLGGCFSFMFLL